MTSDAYDGPWVLGRLLDDRAERLGDREAVRGTEGQRSYAALRDRASRLGAGLLALGLAPGDRVATMLDTSIASVETWLAIVWAGGVEVPVNTEYKGTFLAHVLRDSGARVLVVDARWVERLAGLDLPDLDHVVVVPAADGSATVDGDPAAAGRLTVGARRVAVHHLDVLGAADAVPAVVRQPDDLAYIIYTSGTTGASKGVMHTHRSTGWYVQPFRRQLGWQPGDVVYCNFPFFHQMGRTSMTTTAFWEGAAVALRPRFSATAFWDDVRDLGATIFGYLGAIILLLDAQPERDDDRDHPLRVGFGAAAPPELMTRFTSRFGVTLLENYGSTECGVPSFAMPGDVRPGTMGRPAWYLEVAIHDEQDRPLPAGQRGEIVVRPREPGAIFSGYWNRPEATLEAFRNLWFHSGDQGELTADGYLVYTDRLTDSMRRRGENISSFEVERAMQAHDAVVECAAYAVPSELTEDEVMVAVVLSEPVDPGDLLRFAAETMPRFAVPRYLRIVDALPRTPTQRVQKFLLREAGVTPDTVDRLATAPADPPTAAPTA